MGDKSSIEWTDATWNPIRGCSRVSEGCRNCYAERTAIRQAGPGRGYEGLVTSTPAGPRWTGEVRFAEDMLDLPLRWKRPRRIFVNSMSDLFHEKVADEWIDRIFAVMAWCDRHVFQVLTKRPARMLAYLATMDALDGRARALRLVESMYRGHPARRLVAASPPRNYVSPLPWPLPNVWLGVSVEHQAAADERIPLLLQTPAAVRFLSVEPLLGPVDLTNVSTAEGESWNALEAEHDDRIPGQGPRIDWVIVGGESGPGARPCDLAWIRSVVGQAKAASVPCFVKQIGAHAITGGVYYRPTALMLHDRKGGDPAEWPEDLRVREFPR